MRLRYLAIASFALIFLSSCLTFSRRVFTYTSNKDGSVDLLVQYFDIRSGQSFIVEQSSDTGFIEKDDMDAFSAYENDYNQMIEQFFVGEYFNNCYPTGKIHGKKLYVENNQLNGEFKVHFNSLKDAGIVLKKGEYNFRTDSLCNFFPFIDSISVPVIDLGNYQYDQVNGENSNPYYLLKWTKKTQKLIIDTSPYYNEGESKSMAEIYLKYK